MESQLPHLGSAQQTHLTQSCCPLTGKVMDRWISAQPSVLLWAGVEIIFFTAAGMGLYLGFLLETVVVTVGCFPYFLHKPCGSRACILSMPFWLLTLPLQLVLRGWHSQEQFALCLARPGEPTCQGKQHLYFREKSVPCCAPHLWKSPAECPHPACPLSRADLLTLTLEDWEEKPKGKHRRSSQ